jgi:hypothetical protein
MNIYIPHPRLLVAVLILLGIGFGVYSVLADDERDGSGIDRAVHVPATGSREIPELQTEDVTRAREIAEADPVFGEAVSMSSATDTYAIGFSQKVYVGDEPTGVLFHAVLESPIELSGPWRATDCGQPILEQVTYREIRQLVVVVDTSEDRVLSLAPYDAVVDQEELSAALASRQCKVPPND